MKQLILSVLIGLLLVKSLQAQDSLAHYSLAQLDSIYTTKKKAKEQLPYALAMLEKGSQVFQNQDTAYARLLYAVGHAYQNLRNFPKASEYLQQAIDIQKVKMPQHPRYANTLYSMGFVHFYQGQFEKTKTLWLQTLDIRQAALGEKHLDCAAVLNALAILYDNMGDYTTAESFCLRSLAIKKELLGEQHPSYASSLYTLATLYAKTNNYSAAEALMKQSLSIEQKNMDKNPSGYANSLQGLAITYTRTNNYAAAEPLFLKAIELDKKTFGEKHPSYALGLNNLAACYIDMGNYEAAESLLQQALQIRKETLGEKHPDYASTLMNLATLQNRMAHYTTAEALFLEALQIQKATIGENHPEYAKTLSDLGNLYEDMGKYALADSVFVQSIAIFKATLGEQHHEYAKTLNDHANVRGNIGDYASAKALHIQALNCFTPQHFSYARCLNNVANICRKSGELDSAQYYLVQVLPAFLDYFETQGATLGEKAKQELFKTMAVPISHIHFFAAFHRQHDSLLITLQNSSLFSKGYALAGISELLPFIKSLKDSTLTNVYNAWTFSKFQLGKAYEMSAEDRAKKGINLDSLKQLTSNQEATLMRSAEALKERLGYNKKRLHYKDLVSSIAKDEVVIDFVRFVNEKSDTAWYYALVTQQGWQYPQYIALCTEAQLLPYADIDIRPDQENYITQPDVNRRVYDLLIRPLEPFLKKKKRIHWASVGIINRLALSTLQDDKNKMLAQRFELHQYSALKDFILKRQADGSTGQIENSVLLVGDVAFDLDETEHKNLAQQTPDVELYASRAMPTDSTRGTTRFSRLTGTKIEIEQLDNSFSSKQWAIEKLQESNALEERIREYTGDKTPRVLHFATHGFFIPAKKQGEDNPLLRSGIALAGANRVWLGKKQIEGVEDGLWTAYEIANLDLHRAELVVLSACETARGQIDPNEGVLGLQRAFKIAGVDNMILSLWQVPDKETVELMQAFYKHYLNGETPAVALHKAQADMRKKYPNPYYWAAFILIE